MNRRTALQTLGAGAFLSASQCRTPRSVNRPNIVLIMADDMGFADLGCFGGEIDTPNIDRLATGGMRFTHFYNASLCCPTRASILTGLYSHQVGIGEMMSDRGLPGYRGDLGRNCVTIAEALRGSGYRTSISGKWHLTPTDPERRHNWPLRRGFDRFFGTIWGGGNYFAPAFLARGNELIEPASEEFYYTDAVADHAVESIREFSHGEEPFFSYVAFTAPHWPLHAPEALVAKYRGRYDAGWDHVREERYRRQIELGIIDAKWRLTPRDSRVPAWHDAPNRKWLGRGMEVYAAQVDSMDQGVGRIMSALRELGQEENTLVMFLSDNGGSQTVLGPDINQPAAKITRDGRPIRRGNNPEIMPGPDDTYQSYAIGWGNASNTPFRQYKEQIHEGGISTLLIASWPGVIRSGSLTHDMGHVIDIMPSCLEVAKANYPAENRGNPVEPLEGKTLLPVLRGGSREGHEALFWEHRGNRAVRQGKWKLASLHPGSWELFDMEADRTEMNDLSAREPHRVRQLIALYDRWAQRCHVVPRDQIRG